MSQFAEFKLLASLQKTLSGQRIATPTEIQNKAIPHLMAGRSIVGISETGSGKTLAYALPILHALKKLEDSGDAVEQASSPRAVVIVPTRELGEQVSKVFKNYTHETRLRVRPALGGTEFEQVRRSIGGPFEVLIATPGRIIQLIEKKMINLADVRTLIIDEADQMLDAGFLPDSNNIKKFCPEDVQLGLFSATVSPAVEELMNTMFVGAEVIRSEQSGKTVKTLITKNMSVENGKRWPIFEKLLKDPIEGGTIVFVNTREQCDTLAREIVSKGFSCGIYRGEMDRNERRQNLKKFREGQIQILVATDLAGRGLDVPTVGRVINFHMPKQMDNYIHRAGRTARAGRSGVVINLVTERDQVIIAQLEGKTEDEGKEAVKTAIKARAKTFGKQSQGKQNQNKKFQPKKKSFNKSKNKPRR